MASMSDTIILDSDSEDSNDGIMIVEQISGKRSRSAAASTTENDRKIRKSFENEIVEEGPPSLSTVDMEGEILAVLSTEVIEKRRLEVEALKAEYGEDDAGWGVKAIMSKMGDQDVVSGVVVSILPLLNRSDPTDSFSVVTVVGSQTPESFPGYRVFPPLRVRIDLSLHDNQAKFSVVSSWLLKDHTKRLKNELERRYKKHYGSLLAPIKWLRHKSVKFLLILKHRRIFYGAPDAEDRKPHYITFHDPMNARFMFQSIADKMALFEGTDLASGSAFDCPICFDHKASMAAVMFPQCKHYFCRGCVSQDLSLKIKEGQLKDLKCLQHGCSVLVDMDMLKLWVDSTTFQRYCDLTTDQFLDQSKEVIRCPKKECNIPMELAQNAPREVQCLTCSHQFCATCKAAPHPGVPCLTDAQKKEIREEWKASDDAGREALKKRVGEDNVRFALEDAESEEWISKNAKPCPKCNTPIQKIDGCNKMVCTSKGCKTYFCWLCGKKLDNQNPYAHFSEAGGCNGMLHTRIGPDGQRINPFPQLNVNFNGMGLHVGGAVNAQLLLGGGMGIAAHARHMEEYRLQMQAEILRVRAEEARVARPARRAPPAVPAAAPRVRHVARRAPAPAAPAAPAQRTPRRRAAQDAEAAFRVPHVPVAAQQARAEQGWAHVEPHQRRHNRQNAMAEPEFNFQEAFQFVQYDAAPVGFLRHPQQHQQLGLMAPQEVYGNGQNFFGIAPPAINGYANPVNPAPMPVARRPGAR